MMKNLLKSLIKTTGYEIRKTNYTPVVKDDSENAIGSDRRPVGIFNLFLEDIKQRGLHCKSILDVGANQANWSRMAKNIFPNSSIYLIEPQVELKDKLEEFCKEYANAHYFLAGAGSKKETLTLTIWDDLAGSSLLPTPNEDLKQNGKQREIEIITIDDLMDSAKIEMPDLIKLDVQGFELEALKGANKTFGNTEAYIMEVSLFPFSDNMPVITDVIDFMLERDYVVYDFPGFLRRPLDGALGQCDICFVKKDGILRASKAWN